MKTLIHLILLDIIIVKPISDKTLPNGKIHLHQAIENLIRLEGSLLPIETK